MAKKRNKETEIEEIAEQAHAGEDVQVTSPVVISPSKESVLICRSAFSDD